MKASAATRRNALTRVELLVVLGVVMVVAVFLVMPALAPRQEHGRITCVSNLRQIGLGWQQWANDHEANDFPFRVTIARGGTMGTTDPFRNAAWWQFALISNELSSPKVLVCPEDWNLGKTRRIADNWASSDPRGGYMTLGFRDRATSYTIGLEASSPAFQSDLRITASDQDSMTLASQARPRGDSGILGTDRNILFNGRDATCSSGTGETEFIRVKGRNGQNPPASAVWTNAIHGLRGNVLAIDGNVQQSSAKEFNARCDLSDDSGRIHFLVPK